MKLFTVLLGLLCFGLGLPDNGQLSDKTDEPIIIATIELNDGTLFSQEITPSEVYDFEATAKEKFGEEAFCCCSYQMENGDCYRRRVTCEESRVAFCQCAAEELDLEGEIPWCD